MTKTCEVCSAVFENHPSYWTHMKRRHGPSWPCKFCGVVLKSRIAKRAHEGDACLLNPFKFTQQDLDREVQAAVTSDRKKRDVVVVPPVGVSMPAPTTKQRQVSSLALSGFFQ